ncbi:Gluconate transport-inducing protein [Sorochytrium milnesiophthora]
MARQGRLPMVPRRLTPDQQRLIRSGTVLVFEESTSQIRRWTDGRCWSTSRVKDRFFVYREVPLSKALRNRLSLDVVATATATRTRSPKDMLRKRVISLHTAAGRAFRLVCYYCEQDVQRRMLPTPSSDARFAAVHIAAGFYTTGRDHVPLMLSQAVDLSSFAQWPVVVGSAVAPVTPVTPVTPVATAGTLAPQTPPLSPASASGSAMLATHPLFAPSQADYYAAQQLAALHASPSALALPTLVPVPMPMPVPVHIATPPTVRSGEDTRQLSLLDRRCLQ